jgi:retron-type reverse transcriptase
MTKGLKAHLALPAQSGADQREIAQRRKTVCTQGGPLSPLLSNIVLNELVKEMANGAYVL